MRIHPIPKKLLRLPHVFAKVLELPFGADFEVSVEEYPDGFRFTAASGSISGEVGAHAIEICPGVTKVVVGAECAGGEVALQLDRWRFRLPPSTLPAMATAAYVDGELVVIVPKGAGDEEEEVFGSRGFGGGIGRLVAVQ
ncbi:uncharacterized protein [Typha latifolia]|uniref:uncharacterized protein n=1 Tax=Typha latifolia TaxID=4733 RepID=UPI003C30BB0B